MNYLSCLVHKVYSISYIVICLLYVYISDDDSLRNRNHVENHIRKASVRRKI